MEDAVHRIQRCTGQSSAFSIEIATWRITTAATKATGTVLTDADEVLSFEAMLRASMRRPSVFMPKIALLVEGTSSLFSKLS